MLLFVRFAGCYGILVSQVLLLDKGSLQYM
jgi:hypothetical protein